MVSKSMKGFTMSKSESHKRAQQKAAGKNGSTEKKLKGGKNSMPYLQEVNVQLKLNAQEILKKLFLV